jgi:LysR family glycine cleavage system transcriptional activator
VKPPVQRRSGTPRRAAARKVQAAVPKTHARLPLAALRVFAAVAARRSFSEAGAALNLSTAAVSMQIKALEDYLQLRLLRRSSHSVALTPEGERLVPYVQRGLDELEQGFRMVRAERSGGVLVASLLSSFLNSWLVSRLPEFFAEYPEIDLRLQCTKELADFARSDVHVAVRMGRGNWPGLHADKLFDEYLVPLCSAELLARHGPLSGPGSTGNYPLLHSSSEPWAMWTSGHAYSEHWPARGAVFDDSLAILSGAAHGQGLVLSRWSLAQSFLASGQLVRASNMAIRYDFSCWFVCPTAYLEMDKVQVFRRWLLRHAAALPVPDRIA